MSVVFSGGAYTDYTGKVEGAGQSIAAQAGVGPDGTAGYVTCTTTTTNDVYAYKTITALSSSNVTFRIVVADLFDFVMSNSASHQILRFMTSGSQRSYVQLKYLTASGWYLSFSQIDNAGTPHITSEYVVTTDTEYIQLAWQKSSDGSTSNAWHRLYFDDTLKEEKGSYINTTRLAFDEVRIGAFNTLDTGSYDTYSFNGVEWRNDSTLPGSPQVSPSVTDISNTTGTFGTQKSVACTLNAGTSDIARCDVSTDGTALITLTASGSASITNNGTTAVYVTGTSADVIATLGNDIKLDGVRSGTELSHTETITVLVTDTLDATGNDTFDITWSVPTGVGTQTLYLTGTHAQLNAALAAVEVTGTVEETIQCLMYSVTSTPLTDTDIFNITFEAAPISAALPANIINLIDITSLSI